MKLFVDVIFALLPLVLVVVPIVALIVVRAVLARREKKNAGNTNNIH